jgi:hypothetical protein
MAFRSDIKVTNGLKTAALIVLVVQKEEVRKNRGG